jgi:hypothetical protein
MTESGRVTYTGVDEYHLRQRAKEKLADKVSQWPRILSGLVEANPLLRRNFFFLS